MKNIRSLSVFSVLLLFVSGLCTPSFALQTVGTGGTHATIAAGLAAAAAGEEVRVIDQGTYAEILNISDVILTSDPVGATIDSTGGIFVMSGTQDVTIRGFTLTGSDMRGIHCQNEGIKNVENVTINGGGITDMGIYTDFACTINVVDTVIQNPQYDCITVDAVTANGFTLNISGSELTGGGRFGMFIRNAGTVTVTDTSIHDNSARCVCIEGSEVGSSATTFSFTGTDLYNCANEAFLLESTVTDGVTVTLDDCEVYGSGANAIAQFNDSTFNILNSYVHDNTYDCITQEGGAPGAGFDCNISNSIFANGRHGVGTFRPAAVTVSDSTFTGLSGFGVVVAGPTIQNTSLQATGNYFSSNTQALGILDGVAAAVDAEISNNIFEDGSGNTAAMVALINANAGSTFTNNLLDGGGIGLYVGKSEVNVYHNTIVNSVTGVDIYDGASMVVDIQNNIVDDVTLGILSSGGSGLASVTVDNNLVNGSTQNYDGNIAALSGTGNIESQAADFTSPSTAVGSGDYTLLASSPAIDAGANLGVSEDIEGTVRPQGSGPDLGAYESNFSQVTDWNWY